VDMKKWLIVMLLLLPMAAAQLDWKITDLRCDNDKLDDFELCENGVEETFCDDLGDLLGIDAVCDVAHCTCLPRVNTAYCGNDIREGVEVCDGSAEDFCPAFGNITGLPLKCNEDTCGCDLDENIPDDYNPRIIITELHIRRAQVNTRQLSALIEKFDTLRTRNTNQTSLRVFILPQRTSFLDM